MNPTNTLVCLNTMRDYGFSDIADDLEKNGNYREKTSIKIIEHWFFL